MADKTYAVIYNSWDETQNCWVDDMYEPFETPEEAVETFLDMAAGLHELFNNPRVVLILDTINPPTGKTWG